MDYAPVPVTLGSGDDMPSAAQLIRQARIRSGLTQQQLAVRMRVTQALVSDYERGRRQPTLPTLTRFIRATGCDLRVELDPAVIAL